VLLLCACLEATSKRLHNCHAKQKDIITGRGSTLQKHAELAHHKSCQTLAGFQWENIQFPEGNQLLTGWGTAQQKQETPNSEFHYHRHKVHRQIRMLSQGPPGKSQRRFCFAHLSSSRPPWRKNGYPARIQKYI